MNNITYWKIRNILLRCNFIFKKLIYKIYNRIQDYIGNASFRKILIYRIIIECIKSIFYITLFFIIDMKFIKTVPNLDTSIFADIIIGAVGVTGVILGLLCSNISSIYSTRYLDAPEKISYAFQHNKLTEKCMKSLIGFIIYGMIVLLEIMLKKDIGWLTGTFLILWFLKIIISYGVVGNRIYQLSDIFKLSEDAFTDLHRIISKNLYNDLFSMDKSFQSHFCKLVKNKIDFLRTLKNYGLKRELKDNSSVLGFMDKNIILIEKYWGIKKSIPQDSLWFRREGKYQKWHLASSTEISLALNTGTLLKPKQESNYYWFEDEIISLNHDCINFLFAKNDFESIYNHLLIFEKICKSAILNKEAFYYIEQIDWLKNKIEKVNVSKNSIKNISFIGIVEQLSVLYLKNILEVTKYLQNLNINNKFNFTLYAIDLGNNIDNIKEIRGEKNVDFYNKILFEVHVEEHRVTPDWLIKQHIAKEEYKYLNILYEVIKESIEHIYSLGKNFIDKGMNYEACIVLIRFYEYESKLSNFYYQAEKKEVELNQFHLDKEDKWEESHLTKVKDKFNKCKSSLPELLLKCTSDFIIENWDHKEDYPDFLGECYNHIAEDTIEALINNDKVQFENNFKNLTKLMMLYQEYIRSDFIKHKDLYRVEYIYYMFTSPIVEWAQIGGLAITWGEVFSNDVWKKIVLDSYTEAFNKGDHKKYIEISEKLIEYVQSRNEFMSVFDSRGLIETGWNQKVETAIRNSGKITTEYSIYGKQINTESKLLKAFCPSLLDLGFTINPSEVFWVTCVNPLLPSEKKFHTKYSWGDKLNGK